MVFVTGRIVLFHASERDSRMMLNYAVFKAIGSNNHSSNHDRKSDMNLIPETKKNHLWHKILWHTDPDDSPLGPFYSIEVYCCEEANGYAIWYVRRLARDDCRGPKGFENGDYLLKYFSKHDRDAALERAVLISNDGATIDKIIEKIDNLAAAAQKV
jgi:hypothetical protein